MCSREGLQSFPWILLQCLETHQRKDTGRLFGKEKRQLKDQFAANSTEKYINIINHISRRYSLLQETFIHADQRMRFCAVFQTTNFHMEVWARTTMLKGLIDTLTPRSDSHVTSP